MPLRRSGSLSMIVIPANDDFKNIDTWHDRYAYYRTPTGNTYVGWKYGTFLAQKTLPWHHHLSARSNLYEDHFPYLTSPGSYLKHSNPYYERYIRDDYPSMNLAKVTSYWC